MQKTRSTLVHSSLLRVTDRQRRRFQLHALLRDQVRAWQANAGLCKLQERHAAALEGLFKDWETRLPDCRECLEEVLLAAQFLWKRGESDREGDLGYWAYELCRKIGELDRALHIMKQEESFCVERDSPEAKIGLYRSYLYQAQILLEWGRVEEALALRNKEEAICLELGDKSALGYCYWGWAWLAWEQGDKETKKQKLEQALAIFTELKMRWECDRVQEELDRPPAWGKLESLRPGKGGF